MEERITESMSETRPHVGGVILAAGEAKRMGSTKQLLDLGGRPLLQHVLDAAGASSLDELVLVVGHDAEAVLEAVDPGRARVVINPLYGEGQSTSLKAGLASLRPGLHGALVLLGDQPFVTTDIIDRLVAAFVGTDAPVVAPSVEGRRSNPVLVREDLFPALLAVSGDQGGREVVAGFASETVLVPVEGPGIEIDVDTAAELEHVRSLW